MTALPADIRALSKVSHAGPLDCVYSSTLTKLRWYASVPMAATTALSKSALSAPAVRTVGSSVPDCFICPYSTPAVCGSLSIAMTCGDSAAIWWISVWYDGWSTASPWLTARVRPSRLRPAVKPGTLPWAASSALNMLATRRYEVFDLM